MNCRMGLTTVAIVLGTISVTGAAALTSAARPDPADPPPPTGIASTASAAIDESALMVLKKVETAMFGLKSYRAECWTTITHDPKSPGSPGRTFYEMATLVAVKPNLMRYDAWEMTADNADRSSSLWKRKSETPTYTFVCDGRTNWKQFGTSYRTDTRTKPQSMSTILEPWNGFYSAQSSPYAMAAHYQKEKGLLEARLDGTEIVDGTLCDRVVTHTKTSYGGSGMEYHTTLYVGQKDGLVRRQRQRIDFEGKRGYVRDATLRRIRANMPVSSPKTVFAYTPPDGVTLEKPRGTKATSLLARGTPAPDFTATDKDGKSVRLSDFRGKVVILDFWASWCPPCIASMPHNQAVAKKLQEENLPVVLLALDNSEAREPFVKWVNEHKEMNALTFVYADPKTEKIAGDLYKVTGIPTQYIIDAKGIIRDFSVGFGGPNDVLEKSVRRALEAQK